MSTVWVIVAAGIAGVSFVLVGLIAYQEGYRRGREDWRKDYKVTGADRRRTL